MVEDVLLEQLCCKTNDVMNKSLLPAVVHEKEEKRKEGYGKLAACGWLGGEGRFLYEGACYGLR